MSKLADLVHFNPSVRLKKGEVAPFIEMAALPTNARDIPELGAREFSGSGSKFENGDTLFARITPCLENGKGGYVSTLRPSTAGHGSTEFIVLRAKSPSDSLFVYYLTREPEFRRFAEKQMSGTSGRQRVTWQALAEYELPEIVPSQRAAIAATLGALDDKIELNRKMNATLEAMARALFRDWFVDFGPTRAKMEGREPYLSPDLWSLFPDRLDDEGKPTGWEMGTLGDLVSFNPKEALKRGTAAPYLDMASLPTQGASHDEPIQRDMNSGSKFKDGDTLLARITPCLENGKTCLVNGLGNETVGWGSTEFIVMRPRPPLPQAFAYLVARDPDFRQVAIKSMTGTSGRQRATVNALAEYPFVLAPAGLVKAFGDVMDDLFSGIAHNERESRTLARTRDLLLPRLMSGELRVAQVERLVSEVA